MKEYRHSNHGLTDIIWAESVPEILVSHTRMQETKSLVSAFNPLRQQIRARQQRLETIMDNAAEGSIVHGLLRLFQGPAHQQRQD